MADNKPRRQTPQERLREQLEESRRDLETLPAWIRETPPAFESDEARRLKEQVADDNASS